MNRPSRNAQKRAMAQADFLYVNGPKLIDNMEFNRTVNTRQVRRQYARVMEKRES